MRMTSIRHADIRQHNGAAKRRCCRCNMYLLVRIKGDRALCLNRAICRDSGIRLQSGETLAVDALFIAVGRQPRTEPFARLVELDPVGYIRAGEDCRTTAQGIFCAGDCRTKSTRQLCTAAADGAAAALGLCEWLSNEKKQA